MQAKMIRETQKAIHVRVTFGEILFSTSSIAVTYVGIKDKNVEK
jgi:hypothetical protein